METLQEIEAVMNVASTRNLMTELQVLLDQWKECCETNTVHVKQDKAPMKSRFHERMTRIESYWEDLNEPFQKGSKNTCRTISKLREIKGLLKKLPRSHSAKLQARFSSLCAEAETIMGNMMDRMKIQCNKRPSL
ncbi:hypothetical protein HanRHA438_Chr11g0507301 [Helianthus annuus]|nr:hypothetical protein HanHA300_Chr11g0405611 [Helianthus annuus]KAJ0509749.1 hypothetical protein HanIR_Chr11g0532691 [Helianthus annuus]KAJ0517755.1 hypothetical protein HanHA89_Chr11g0429331 [Helianthus annuus]KAJ0685772.1 hypothetical protein HanLR1_Chr11g0406831 [Helianthus annuus]KAJ0689646.1 hypothetical protein HanOQP8_Chr11g0408451 [Helianthus annuus]